MRQYSIRDLAQLSGVKAHTIRTWEQRYGLLQPQRTATNFRYYREEDLLRLLQVATLCASGQRISDVAQLSEQARKQAVQALSTSESAASNAPLNALLAAMLNLDEPLLARLLTQAIAQQGLEKAMLELVYPLLQRIGLSWQIGTFTVAHEHLLSNLVRQKLLAAIDALGPDVPVNAPRWLLFLPDREQHELALLFLNHALRIRGQHVLYLGASLPLADLVTAYATFQPAFIATVLTTSLSPDLVNDFATELRQGCPGSELLLYGPLAQHLQLPLLPGTHQPARITDILSFIEARVTSSVV
ncbi:MerR family transcriptional regulator [Hymenobacter sp. H14-R3]|uniref:MerR family transcriptional regulator n=1 Tax=Hymenobacter sp. H14-R3 TaxID=3046308 RepID=UPI0024BA87ED|nr:MerR family transcriptional regulator [Hymenobacter sp. H14-R3]MDJ0367831.1 MerR family transcriptional regulator [Hymenobacter sp. H14-R3]